MNVTRLISYRYGKYVATVCGGYLNAITTRSFPAREMAIHYLTGFGR